MGKGNCKLSLGNWGPIWIDFTIGSNNIDRRRHVPILFMEFNVGDCGSGAPCAVSRVFRIQVLLQERFLK